MDPSALPELWSRTHGSEDALETLPAGRSYSFQAPLAPVQLPQESTLDFGSRSLIGRGGMGEVYAVPQAQLERTLAVKTMRRDRASPESLAVFLAEAVVTGQLEHPNIVPVHALGKHEDAHYIAMQRVQGQTWQEAMRERPEDLPGHIETLIQVGNALAYAHSQGIAHNDLKPANVMLGRFGEVYLLDWGLATRFGDRVHGSRVRHAEDLTGPGGTPAYFPPELATGNGLAIGPWTDVYLLGASLHELLCGRPPHGRASLYASLMQMAAGSAWHFPPQTPSELARLCERALAFHPEQRIQSASSFVAELRGFLRHRESLKLTDSARELLTRTRSATAEQATAGAAEYNQLYQDFAESVARFRQAHALWDGNHEARSGEQEARRAYARSALQRGDLGLAEAQAAHLDDAALQSALSEARARQMRTLRMRRRLQRGLLASLLVIVCGLSGGTLLLYNNSQTIAAQLTQLEQEKRNADARGGIAENALRRLSDEVQTTLLDRLGTAEAHASARTILGVAIDGFSALRDADYQHSRVQRSTANAHLELGWLKARLEGALPEGLAEFHAAASILRTDPSPEGRLLLGAALRGAAWCLDMLEQLEACQQTLLEAVTLLEELRGSQPHARAATIELARALLVLARVARKTGALESALVRAAQASQMLQEQGAVGDRSLAMARGLQAGVLLRLGRTSEALEQIETSLQLRRRAFVSDSQALQTRRDLASGLILRGNIQLAAGNQTASLQDYHEAHGLLAKLSQLDETNLQDLGNLAVGLLQAAKLQALAPGEALPSAEQALGLWRRLVHASNSHKGWQRSLADCLRTVGRLRLLNFERGAGLAALQEAMQLAATLSAEQPGHRDARLELAESCYQLGRAFWLDEQPARGWQEMSTALAHYDALSDDSAGVAIHFGHGTALASAASLLAELGRPDDALPLAEQSVALWGELVAADPDNTRLRLAGQRSQAELAVLLAQTGDEGRARQVAAPLWDIVRQPPPPGGEAEHLQIQDRVRTALELLGQNEAAAMVARWQRTELERRCAQAPAYAQLQSQLLWALVAEADLVRPGDAEAARELFGQAVQRGRQLAAEHPSPGRLQLCRVLAAASARGGWRGAALADLRRELLALATALLAADPHNLELLKVASKAGSDLGSWALREEQDLDAARELFEHSLDLRRQLAHALPDSFEGRQGLAFGLSCLGDLCKAEGLVDQAVAFYRDSLTLRQGLLEEQPDDPVRLRNYSVGLGRLGLLLIDTGRLEEAAIELRGLVDTREALLAADPDNPKAAMDYAIALSFAAQLELQRGQPQPALDLLEVASEHGGAAVSVDATLQPKLDSILRLKEKARRQAGP